MIDGSDIETAVITLLRGMTEWFPVEGQIDYGTFSVLDKSVNPFRYAVLMPGENTPNEAGQMTAYDYEYEFSLSLFVRYTNDKDTTAELVRMREAVVYELLRNPRLGIANIIPRRAVKAIGPVKQVMDKNGNGPFFFQCEIALCYTRREVISGGEFA